MSYITVFSRIKKIIVTVTAAIYLLANARKGQVNVSVLGSTITNLLGSDGDFETDSNADGLADGWTKVSTPTVSLVTDKQFGSYAQRINSTSINTGIERNISLVNGHKYYVLMYQKGLSAASSGINLRIVKADASFTTVFAPTGTFSWTKYSAIYTADGTEQKVYLRCSGTAGETKEAYTDGVMFVDLTARYGAGSEPILADCDKALNFVNNTKSANSVRVKSINKNLCIVTSLSAQNQYSGAFANRVSTANGTKDIAFSYNADNLHRYAIRVYDISGTEIKTGTPPISGMAYEMGMWKNGSNIAAGARSFVLPARSDIAYAEFGIGNWTTTPVSAANLQVEYGNAVTSSESHQHGEAYTPAYTVLRKVGNAVDEVNITTGQDTHRNGAKVLQASDITTLETSLVNVDVVYIAKPTDSLIYGNTTTPFGAATLGNIPQKTVSGNDDVSNIGYFSTNKANNSILYYVTKGTYANLAAAQTALTGLTEFYQLGSSIVTYPTIRFFENGVRGYGLKCYGNNTTFMQEACSIYEGKPTAGAVILTSNDALVSLIACYRNDGTPENPIWVDVLPSLPSDALNTSTKVVTITGADNDKDYFVAATTDPSGSALADTIIQYPA